MYALMTLVTNNRIRLLVILIYSELGFMNPSTSMVDSALHATDKLIFPMKMYKLKSIPKSSDTVPNIGMPR